jgi:hypothetical protein
MHSHSQQIRTKQKIKKSLKIKNNRTNRHKKIPIRNLTLENPVTPFKNNPPITVKK